MYGSNDDYNPFGRNYLLWLSMSISIIVLLHVILPFPISFIVSIIVILGLGIFRGDRALKKAGMGGIKAWYKSMSTSRLGPPWSNGTTSSAYQQLSFSCLNCGNRHDKIACPNCGSKGVRPV